MICTSRNELWSPPILVDFTRVDRHGRLCLDIPGTVRELDRYGITLREGVRLVVYEDDGNDDDVVDDLIGVATATFDDEEGRWVGIGWKETLHFSDLTSDCKAAYLRFRPGQGKSLY